MMNAGYLQMSIFFPTIFKKKQIVNNRSWDQDASLETAKFQKNRYTAIIKENKRKIKVFGMITLLVCYKNRT